MHFTNTVLIERPVAEVFGFLADLRNVPRWNWAIRETRKVTDGPIGVGTRYRQARDVPSPGVEMLEITEFESPGSFRVEGTFGPFNGSLRYELRPQAGGTLLVNEVELRGRGATRLAEPIARSRVQRSVAENLAALRRLLEGGGATP